VQAGKVQVIFYSRVQNKTISGTEWIFLTDRPDPTIKQTK